jgi:soluble cytochrome b562
MKKTLLLIGCAASLMMVAGDARAQSETALGKQMDVMNDAFKLFRRETDPAKGAALAREAQEAVLKAHPDLPELVKVMAEGPEKAKAGAEYRKMMGQLYLIMVEVELAFLAGNMDEVANQVNALRDIKKEGHDKFMEE